MNWLMMIPAPLRLWIALAGVALVLGVFGFIGYKIDKHGYDRCKDQHAVAAAEIKDKSRKEIITLDRKYDKIKNEIGEVEGADSLVGPRTELAIDRMPGSHHDE